MAIDRKFIVTLPTKSGPKEFITFAGLLDAGHNSGLLGIECEILTHLCQPEKDYWVVQATGRFRTETGEAIWTAHGDAHPGNSQMKGALLRHAETRAAARMLRFGTNIGMTAAEEIGPDYDEREDGMARTQPQSRSASPKAAESHAAPAHQRGAAASTEGRMVADQPAGPVCTTDGCGTILTEKEISGCMQKGWPLLCIECARNKVRAEREAREAVAAP